VSARLKYIKDPTSTFERFQVASTCVADLKITIPCLIDDMENTAARAYKGWPDRMYVVGKNGKIAFHGEPGPAGFEPDVMEKGLQAELQRIGAKVPPATE
jgi:iodothyronine deiodinase-like protein